VLPEASFYAICAGISQEMLETLKSAARRITPKVKVYRLVLKDKRAPKLAKVLLELTLGFTALPFDLIPDFIPIIGLLDELLIVLALVMLALKLITTEVFEDGGGRAGGI
jgi:uncharacterized membrane protein YkvA (DUF1232 family)